jgi:hypothetical protein
MSAQGAPHGKMMNKTLNPNNTLKVNYSQKTQA